MVHGTERLVIIGAGDFARELLWALDDLSAAGAGWPIAGFVVDDVDATRSRLGQSSIALPVLGSLADYRPADGDAFIAAIGQPRGKLAACEAIAERGGRFVNVVHPTATVAPDAQLGHGVFLFRNVTVSVGARVGNHVSMNMYATLGHDSVLGDGSTVSSHCDITGRVTVGRGVMMGSHAVILPKARVGDFATVGAGTVVLRSVAAETSVLGVPARAL